MGDADPSRGLTPSERSILALMRQGAHDAEIAVRVGLSVGDVKHRIDGLIARSGAQDRAALAALGAEAFTAGESDRDVWGRRDAPSPGPAALTGDSDPEAPVAALAAEEPRRFSRRDFVLGALGGAAVLAAGGAIAYLALRGDDDTPSGPGGDTPGPGDGDETPQPGASGTPTQPSGAGIAARIQRLDGFGPVQRATFAPGERIDVPEGSLIFVDTGTGAAETFWIPDADAGVEPMLAGAGNRYLALRGLLLDRRTETLLGWDAEALHLVGLSGETAIFAEFTDDGKGGRLGPRVFSVEVQPDGLRDAGEALLDDSFAVSDRFLISPDGEFALAWTSVEEGEDAYGQQILTRLHLAGGEVNTLQQHAHGPDGATFVVDFRPLPDGSGVGYATESWQARDGEEPSGAVEITESAFFRRRWDGAELLSGFVPGAEPHLSPDARLIAYARPLRFVPAEGEGAADEWPAVYLRDVASGEDILRVRSGLLRYGDGLDGNRWLPDSSGLAMLTGGPPEAGPRYVPVILDTGTRAILPLPVPPERETPVPLTDGSYAGPVPCESNSDLIAFGRMAFYNRAADRWVVPEVTTEAGPDHLYPWLGDGSELVFATGHGGHGGSGPGILLEPRLEQPPFDDRMRFVVNTPNTCLNVRPEPTTDTDIVTCLPHDTVVELAESGDPNREPARQAVDFNEEGAWVHVATEDGATRGWVLANYLGWA